MQIYVKTHAGKTIPLDVKPIDTIKEVKFQIKGKYGIPTDKQMLIHLKPIKTMFWGHSISKIERSDNDNTLLEYGIENGSKLQVIMTSTVFK